MMSLPHARGGVSQDEKSSFCENWSSPRPWGCFLDSHGSGFYRGVFPTPVGVFPDPRQDPVNLPRLPHARGGVSIVTHIKRTSHTSSPRPWGCFRCRCAKTDLGRVFPTPVGVFLMSEEKKPWRGCLPHARGGVSRPRAALAAPARSSPRPWGCFCLKSFLMVCPLVFPTPVGVFLPPASLDGKQDRLPHARGGVSARKQYTHPEPQSSPRPWGCFCFV